MLVRNGVGNMVRLGYAAMHHGNYDGYIIFSLVEEPSAVNDINNYHGTMFVYMYKPVYT